MVCACNLPRGLRLFNAVLATFVAFIFSNGPQRSVNRVSENTFLMTGPFFVVIQLVKVSLILYDRLRGIGIREKCKRDYTIGFGGIVIFTLISFTIFCIETTIEARLSVYFSLNILSVVLYITFIRQVDKLCQVDYTEKPFFIILLFHLCVAVLVVIVSAYESYMPYERTPGISILAALFLYFHGSLIDIWTFWEVLMGRIKFFDEKKACMEVKLIKLENAHEMVNRNPGSTGSQEVNGCVVSCMILDETPKEKNASSSNCMECEICFLKFDGNVPEQIPRILIECGHTLCEGCIVNLLKTNNNYFVVCPFCQKVTVIHGGSASQLPKNYAMLKLIR